jgi:2'-5' RNA ligase
MDEAWRVFVAILLPGDIRRELEAAQSALRRAWPGNKARWTHPDRLHLTIKFLGDVEATRVDSLVSELGRTCDGAAAFPLRLDGIGVFPNFRSPRVIWAGVRDTNGALKDLQGRVESALGAFSRETREAEFSGHITLGRIRELDRAGAVALEKAGPAAAELLGRTWEVHAVHVVRSELASGGPHYTALAAVELNRGGPGPA